MDSNPYKAPTVKIDAEEWELETPPKIAMKIKGAWITGLVSAGITLLFVGFAMMGKSMLGVDAWALIDVALMAGLSYGVYRKSRTCAILLLALFALNKVLMYMESRAVSGLLLTVLFFYFFIQGVVGTFQFHRWKREQAPTP